MDRLIDALVDLIKVKTIWSITAAYVFVYLVRTGGISGEIAMATVTAIVTYYFTKKENEAPKATEAPQPVIPEDGLIITGVTEDVKD